MEAGFQLGAYWRTPSGVKRGKTTPGGVLSRMAPVRVRRTSGKVVMVFLMQVAALSGRPPKDYLTRNVAAQRRR